MDILTGPYHEKPSPSCIKTDDKVVLPQGPVSMVLSVSYQI